MIHNSRKERIIHKLQILSPTSLDVINNSKMHAGHLEQGDSDDTHFTIKISSEQLDHLSRIEQHKIINNLLKEEFDSGLHALSIKVISA